MSVYLQPGLPRLKRLALVVDRDVDEVLSYVVIDGLSGVFRISPW